MVLDLQQFKLDKASRETSITDNERSHTQRVTRNAFLKGPVPMNWLSTANKLPGKSLMVGLILWHLRGVRRTPVISLGNKILEEYGIDRKAKARCLKAMQNAGLIKVEQRRGCNPTVTILDIN
jgi:hypothetical protein